MAALTSPRHAGGRSHEPRYTTIRDATSGQEDRSEIIRGLTMGFVWLREASKISAPDGGRPKGGDGPKHDLTRMRALRAGASRHRTSRLDNLIPLIR